jgi:hypothetical protein
MILRLIILTIYSTGLILAEEPSAVQKPVEPTVKKLDDTRYQIGEIIFDHKTREIRFPAKINMVEGLLEYLIVHQGGKVHEALLSTEISPTQLNLAFTLLRYPPSHELYPLPNETGGVSNKFPEVAADIKTAARVTIQAEWSQDGKTSRVPINDWIQHAIKTTAMPPGPWVYGGSSISDGKYSPETTGDIADIFLAPSAILNYPGEDNGDDTVWVPFPKRVPAEGTNVTVIITPFQNTKPLSQP